MADLLCPKCGEPWDMDMLHEASVPYEEARSLFRSVGCEVFDTSHSEQADEEGVERIKALFEIMDDDDAVAAEIEDWQHSVHSESQEADHGFS